MPVEAPSATEGEVRSLPRIGDPAPDFRAETTQGIKSLSDYRGRWVMLFSHPADFTPVCTTELMAFAKRYEEFKKRGVELLGLSIDSIPSHLAWIRDMEAMGTPIPYPIIADLHMKVAGLYGMIHPGASATATVRSVFFIDDKGIIRALIYYPMSLGRNVDELLRVIDGLQTADRLSCSTPVDWRAGEPVVVPPPREASLLETPEQARAKGLDYKTWYLRYKNSN